MKLVRLTANIGNMPLNCPIFQDDIAKMNRTMGDARIGAKVIGRMLERKQLRANTYKSKFAVIGSEKSRNACLKEANHICIGEHLMVNYDSKNILVRK